MHFLFYNFYKFTAVVWQWWSDLLFVHALQTKF